MKCKGGFGTKTGFGNVDENWAPITRDSIGSGAALQPGCRRERRSLRYCRQSSTGCCQVLVGPSVAYIGRTKQPATLAPGSLFIRLLVPKTSPGARFNGTQATAF